MNISQMQQETALDQIPYAWQAAQWQQLTGQWQASRLPHAILLSGVVGLGKHLFAKLLGQLLLCENAKESSRALRIPCGYCQSCYLYKMDNHPNYLSVIPEKVGHSIKIQQIRDLNQFLAQTSSSGGARIVIIEPAEQMTVAAANALLKTLEEPGANSCIMLVSHHANLLPATVRSRCQWIRFASLSASQTQQYFAEAKPELGGSQLKLLTSLSQGAPLQMLRALDENKLQQRQLFWQQWHKLQQGQQDAISAARELLTIDLHDILLWFSHWVLDNVHIKLLPQDTIGLVNTDYQQDIIRASKDVHLYSLFEFWNYLLVTRRTLLEGVNLNKQLVIEDLMIKGRCTILV